MTWTLETSCGHEASKIASLIVPYVQGRALDLGCGNDKAWPAMNGVDNGKVFGSNAIGTIAAEIDDLSMFADGSMDAVFSSHALEDFPRERVPAVLAEWARVLKVGGNLVLYVPSANLYPKVGEPGANLDHKWDIFPGDIEGILREMAAAGVCGWELLESEERAGTNEYSLFIVAKKLKSGWNEAVWERNPAGMRRALVIRFGAIGDQIMAASCLPGLKEQGFHVTYMTTPEAANVVKHDPHIDAWWVQAKDYVPNAELGAYWDSVAERFDRVVNLSESIEGSLLTLPGRLQHAYPDEARRKLFGHVNYLERTHDIAGVPHRFAPKFYPSAGERMWASNLVGGINGPVICWAINGSSAHKVYPWTQVVVKWILDKTPCHVFLLADPGIGRGLQDGILETLRENGADMARVHGMAGTWDIREALTFAQYADCVIGPETGTTNAVSFGDVPKIVYLSHSSHENLTKHWRNTLVLEPETAKAPCFPCHRLHYGWEHCHQDSSTGAALCTSAVAPERIFKAFMTALRAAKAA